jgi:hypothetical protein
MYGSVGGPYVKRDTTTTGGGRAGERQPLMVRSQRTAKVQPVRTLVTTSGPCDRSVRRSGHARRLGHGSTRHRGKTGLIRR